MTDLRPTSEQLRALLRYEKETGHLYRRSGKIAGRKATNGYWRVSVKDREFPAHCVAWAIVTGRWPDKTIDHINRIRSDNRWCNLRVANPSEQMGNARTNRKNTSGARGVTWRKDHARWVARLCIRRQDGTQATRHLGEFRNIEDAKAAYEQAAKRYFGKFYAAPGAELRALQTKETTP